MSRTWWSKFILLICLTVMAGVYVYPTIANLNLETTKFPLKKKVNLGLDLQGGLYLVMGVDFNRFFTDLIKRQAEQVSATMKDRAVSVKNSGIVPGGDAEDPHFFVEVDSASKSGFMDVMKKSFTNLRLTSDQGSRVEFGLGRDYKGDLMEKTLSQSVEVIRNRIDEFGVSEPLIATQGNDRIIIELPGIREVERAKDLIGRTAKLEFKMVDDKSMNPGQVSALVGDIEKTNSLSYKEGTKFSDYVQKVNDFAKGKIPADSQISFERRAIPGTGETVRIPYLLHSKAELTGEDLQDASVGISQDKGAPEVQFSLNPRGADIFDKLTAASIGHAMAIVLDNTVYSAPVINGRIPGGRGVITLGRGNDVMKEAKDLSIVLRAGALPAQLDFLQQRVIGPSLGQDSIKSGTHAGIIGCILLFIVLCLYYRTAGVIAAISLTLNGLFVFAVLIGMDATLTLPGIAGIALTIGMAVDSNVIIFERIRDELREGKRIPAAIQSGFDKAFVAIFDANLTHGIIAAVLLYFGSGPIRGFAVTLLIGIITTVFCAVTVCKLAFDAMVGMSKKEMTELSI